MLFLTHRCLTPLLHLPYRIIPADSRRLPYALLRQALSQLPSLIYYDLFACFGLVYQIFRQRHYYLLLLNILCHSVLDGRDTRTDCQVLLLGGESGSDQEGVTSVPVTKIEEFSDFQVAEV
jgi:hypothetical protein